MRPLIYTLTIALLLSLLVLSAPASADGWQDRLGGVLVAAPNSGPAIGAGLSYQLAEHGWADLFAKRDSGGTALALGVSTDLQEAAGFLGGLLGLDVPRVPTGAAVGAAVDTTGGMLLYCAYHVGF